MKIVINGAGIAGPTLACFLERSGYEVLLVEKSPQLRTGGYAVDFWGAGYDIAEKLGLLPQVHAAGFHVKEMRYVDQAGRYRGGFPIQVFRQLTGDRFIEIQRSELAGVLFHSLGNGVETLFNDSIAGIVDDGPRVQVTFEHATPRTVDLVIGADGLHSRVRQLVFGQDAEFEVPLGYHVAAFQLDDYQPRDELVAVTHSVPGRQVTRLSFDGDRTLCLFVFRDEYLRRGGPVSGGDNKTILRRVFADMGWECPNMLTAMDGVESIYLDTVSQIRMPTWTQGRVALIGDAAACVSLLAGEGTGLGMTEAYVLAGELKRCGGDHVKAFARYEHRLMPLLRQKQKSALRLASSFAPKTGAGIVIRNQLSRLLRIPLVARLLVGRAVKDDFRLPEYGLGQ